MDSNNNDSKARKYNCKEKDDNKDIEHEEEEEEIEEQSKTLIEYLETYIIEQNEQIKYLNKENQSLRNDYLILYENFSRMQIDFFKQNQEFELKQLMQKENLKDFKEYVSHLNHANTMKIKSKQTDEIQRLKTDIEILKKEIVLLNQLLDKSKNENANLKDQLTISLTQLNNLHIEFDCLKSSYMETCINYFKLIDEKKNLIQNKTFLLN